MRRRKHLGLIPKFNILTTALILITALGIGSFVIYQDVTDNYEQLLRHGSSVAAMVAQNSEYALYTEDQDALLQIVKSLSVDAEVAYVSVLNRTKKSLVQKVIYPDVQIPKLHDQRKIGSDRSPSFSDIMNAGDHKQYIDILVPVVSVPDREADTLFLEMATATQSPETIGYIQIGLSLEGLKERIWGFLQSMLTFMSVLSLFGVLITVLMTRRIVSPLQQLAAVTHDISEGNFDHQIDINTHDEINDLAIAFRHMVTRLRDYREQVVVYQKDLESKKEAAESASQAKSQFLAAMSHEIRTPMNGVLGMTELLQGTELTDKQRRFVETVYRSGESLLTIINDILDFSKIEAGKLELEYIDFDLRQVVEEVAELFAERAHGKGIELACQIYDDVPTALQGDPHRLRQICINLLGNALKFTEQGEVVIQVTQLEASAQETLIRFAVKDTGIGISSQAQTKIFESFSQADGSTTRKYGGTGLGLTISRQLAELMGGKLDVDSKPGHGSTFWWTARLEKQPENAQRSQLVTETLQGLRVLVVDDNATNREILHHQVVSWGMHNGSAEDGPHALRMLSAAAAQNTPYDIAILDMHMPQMDGLQLAHSIKADASIAGVQLVMLTSVGQYGDIEAARQAGIEAYLSKPVRQADLYECLTSVMGVSMQPSASPTTPHAMPDQISAHVLLAEDNPVNQEVALSMLELLGCQIDIANNGQEAFEATATSNYDIILMDCQMPEMDGFEATQVIRNREAFSAQRPHVPIIALTANAMQGDRERCLTAGMDDYLSKPFTQDKLQAILLHWCPQPAEEQASPAPTAQAAPHHAQQNGDAMSQAQSGSERIADLAPQALAELKALGNSGILGKVIQRYTDHSPTLLQALREAIAADDAKAVRDAAHSLKSSSASLGATQLAALSEQLEIMGREQHIDDAPRLFTEMEAEYAAVLIALDRELQQPASDTASYGSTPPAQLAA